jgi:hypothetical protein
MFSIESSQSFKGFALTDNTFAIKRTGKNAASQTTLNIFTHLCNTSGIPITNIIVTDGEHELLSPDAYTPFEIETIFGDRIKYNTVMEAYIDMAESHVIIVDKVIPRPKEHITYNIPLMGILNYEKFNQHTEARKVLLETSDIIVYKNIDNYWGSTVPEFKGGNLVGQMLVKIREQLR